MGTGTILSGNNIKRWLAAGLSILLASMMMVAGLAQQAVAAEDVQQMTIKEILDGAVEDQKVTFTGTVVKQAGDLDDEYYLVEDDTGEILVDFDDAVGSYQLNLTVGDEITVTGEVELDGEATIEIDVFSLVLADGRVIADGETEDENEAKDGEADDEDGKDDDDEAKEKLLDILEDEMDDLEDEIDQLEDRIDSLEDEYEDLVEEGKIEEAAEVNVQIEALEEEKLVLRRQRREQMLEIRSNIRARYSKEELAELDLTKEELREMYEDIRVLPVESVVAKGRKLKFDTPPVIKGNRTLLPVRAISEGFGADVQWDEDERRVTITKDAILIILWIDNAVTIVNGEEVAIDVPAGLMNNRAMLPMRFIIEILGSNVNWDPETETIEIEEVN